MMAQRPGTSEMRTELADLERDLRRLKSDLGQLEIDYKMFFAGQRTRPPYALRSTVEALVRRLDRTPIQGSGERFRFNTLQHRLRTFVNLWDREVRAREEGRPGVFSRPT
jgi:hypothetical protein